MNDDTKYILSLVSKTDSDDIELCNILDTFERHKYIDWSKIHQCYDKIDTTLSNVIKGYMYSQIFAYEKLKIKMTKYNAIQQSIKFFEKAVELGSVKALEKLGDIYTPNYRNKEFADVQKAIQYYEKAVELGSVKALEKLGDIYTPNYFKKEFANVQKAIKYYEKAVELGSVKALDELGDIYCDRFGKNLDIKDSDKAVQCYKKAVELGCSISVLTKIGDIYCDKYDENPDIKDLDKAIYYFNDYSKYFEENDVPNDILNSLGHCYYDKWKTSRDNTDLNNAIKYHKNSVIKCIDSDSSYELAFIYYIQDNYIEAIKYFKISHKHDNIYGGHSAFMIGCFYLEGRGVDENNAKAMEWYLLSAEKKDTNSMIAIGDMHYNGEGVDADDNQAIEWYNKAIETSKFNIDTVFKITDNIIKKRKNTIYHHIPDFFKLLIKHNFDNSKIMNTIAEKIFDYISRIRNKLKDMVPLALKCYEQAIKLKNADAMLAMANMYHGSQYIKKDRAKCIEYTRMAFHTSRITGYDADYDDVYEFIKNQCLVCEVINAEHKELLENCAKKDTLNKFKMDSIKDKVGFIAFRYIEPFM